MTFLGLERPIEYGRQLIFDPTTALMVLEAQQQYANAVYNDYQQGVLEMKEFNKEYGNFMSPITADQEWWNNNVTKPVQDLINDAYANGVDLLRSPQGRAMISKLIASRPYGDMALVRLSAENAKEFIKARRDLEKQGLYNPLFALYDGPSLDTYATLGENGQGVWDKMSPTPFLNMATFGNPYFEGMKPTIHKESKNGIEYAVEEINMDDLRRIADAHHNELVNTPQGQMMYKYYQDIARQNGSVDVDGDARQMFNDAVADGQRRRMYKVDDYKDNYLKFEELKNARASLALKQKQLELQRQRNNILANRGRSGSSSSGSGSRDKTPISYYEPLYLNLVINTLNKDPMRSTVFSNDEFTPDMGASVLSALRNIANQYFGESGKDIYGGTISTKKNNIFNSTGKVDLLGRIDDIKLNYTVDSSISNSSAFKTKFRNNYMDYLHLFSGDNKSGFSSIFANSYKGGQAKVDELGYLGKKIDSVKGQLYVSFDTNEIDNIYSAKELAARMAGITGPLLEEGIKLTQQLRKLLKSLNNSIIMKGTNPIGGGDSDSGQYSIYSEVKFKTVGDEGKTENLIGEFVYKTPFSSTPNPNAKLDDDLNLLFDQNTDLERKIMDNSAIRKGFGITSNSGTTDGTLPYSNPWYTLTDDDINSDFDFDY